MLKDQTAANVPHSSLVSRCHQILGKFTRENDPENAQKMRKLIDKYQQNEIIIAFCGHFSSGKSSLINELLKASVLPSSPVPVKSNVVKISPGLNRVSVTYKAQPPKDLSFKDWSQAHNLLFDIDNVETVEFSCPFPHRLPKNLRLLDTPGVDHADQIKQVLLTSPVLLADVIVYVMDYNHVQSEVNFNFVKTLKDMGKPVFLVINQIDKHCDFELDFDFFKDSVLTSFNSWNIAPDKVFYTSLVDPFHGENQLELLWQAMTEVAGSESFLNKSTLDTALSLINSHMEKISARQASEREKFISQAGTGDVSSIRKLQQQALAELDRLQKLPEQVENNIRQEVLSTLEVARLTPYQVTDQARHYLASRKKGFKVGLFFAETKTKEEIRNRLLNLHKVFSEKVTAELDWHLKEVLRKIPEKHGLIHQEYLTQLYALAVDVLPEHLEASVKPGAVETEEYVHQYCRDISTEVKIRYRQEANRLTDYLVDFTRKKVTTEIEAITTRLKDWQEILIACDQLNKLDAEIQTYQSALQNMLLGG